MPSLQAAQAGPVILEASMLKGFGPYGVVGAGEVAATLVVLALAAVAFTWMAYRTRQT